MKHNNHAARNCCRLTACASAMALFLSGFAAVPADALSGAAGQGQAVFNRSLDYEEYDEEGGSQYRYEYTYQLNEDGQNLFCFANDPREFDLKELNGTLYRQTLVNDTKVGDQVIVNLNTVSIEISAYNLTSSDGNALTSPKAVYESRAGMQELAYCRIPLQAKINDVLPDGEKFEAVLAPNSETPFILNAYIGVKGDAKDRQHRMCVTEVRKINGIIAYEDAVEYQKE